MSNQCLLHPGFGDEAWYQKKGGIQFQFVIKMDLLISFLHIMKEYQFSGTIMEINYLDNCEKRRCI